MNIVVLADESVARFGDYDAVIDDAGVWRSVDLHQRAACLAGALVDIGVRPDDRVLLLLPNCAELVIAFTAVLRCGAVAVPLFAGTSPAEVERLVRHSAPAAVIVTAELIPERDAALRSVALRIVVGCDDAAPDGWVPFGPLVSHRPLVEPVPRAPTDMAQLCYTSGTTASPKAVVYTHHGIRARATPVSAQAEEAIIPVALPLNSVGAGLLTQRLSRKWTLVLTRRSDASEFLATIARVRATTLLLVPSFCEALIAVAGLRLYDFSSLRTVDITGAPASASLVDRAAQAFGIRPSIRYGMTEAGGGIAAAGADAPRGSVGRPLPGVELVIRDETGACVAPGVVGEVHVKTPWLAAGYYGEPEATLSRFHDGWLRTGDLGRLDADGHLFLIGRQNEMLIQGGVNVHPQQIADVIDTLSGVGECAVVGVAHEVLGEAAVACIVPQPGSALTADSVLAHCRKHMDARRVPVRVEFYPGLPRTFNGKIHIDALRHQLGGDAPRNESAFVRRLGPLPEPQRRVALRNEMVTLVRGLLPSLPEGAIDPNAGFGDLGLTSLGSMQLVAKLNDLLGRRLPVTLPFTNPSVNALADHIHGLVFRAVGMGATPSPDEPDATDHALAIVGMACRLPRAIDTPEQFWEALQLGRCATGEWPRTRGGAEHRPTGGSRGVPRAAFLERADLFDAPFFGLGGQAGLIDPQHRLLLETAWEAFERAGCNPLGLDGHRVGVFVGISGASYRSPDSLGVSPSMAAARLCHFLDLHGPVITIDTSCSSSLVALHTAVQSLRRHECDLALVAGVKVIADLAGFDSLKLGVLAEDGCSKSFDASADGYGRGEGCVAIVLQRCDAARSAGRTIHAVIRGSAINHDGRSSSVAAPNPRAQAAVIRAAMADAGVGPDDIQYVEAHGTGTLLGDPIEVQALAQAFAPRPTPLAIGSVKSNVGHLEAGAGLAGVLKVSLSLRHRTLPASVHFHEGNPHIPWRDIPIAVQARTGAWPQPDKPLLAGVSSFGLSGTNAHVVLEAPAAVDSGVAPSGDGPWLLPLSARTPDALHALAERYDVFLAEHPHAERPGDVAHAASCGRTHFPQRMAVLGRTRDEWRAALREAVHRPPRRPASAGAAQGVVMLFSGQGSQWWGMGRELMSGEPVFRAAVEHAAAALDRCTSWSLLEELGRDEARSRMSDTDVAQSCLFALQIGLVALWRSWGIEPAVVVGHSVGEIAAACAAGYLSVEDAARLVAARGRLQHRSAGAGRMATVALGTGDLVDVAARFGVEVAAVNAPRMTTIAGPPSAIHKALTFLRGRGVHCKELRTQYAFHTAQMEPHAAALLECVGALSVQRPSVEMVSTLSGDIAGTLDVAYWAEQLRRPVMFQRAIQRVAQLGHSIFLEVGPHPVLVPAVAQIFEGADSAVTLACSLNRARPDRASLLGELKALYETGMPVNWSGLFPVPGAVADIPTYPFERRSYWTSQDRARSARPAPLLQSAIALPDSPDSHLFELVVDLNDPALAYFADHKIFDEAWFPAAGFLELAYEAARHVLGARVEALRDVRLTRALTLTAAEPRVVQLLLQLDGEHSRRFRIFSRPQGAHGVAVEHAEGRISLRAGAHTTSASARPGLPPSWRPSHSGDAVYAAAGQAGVHYGPRFRGLLETAIVGGESIGRLRPGAEVADDWHAYALHPAVLDACFHLLSGLRDGEEGARRLRVPAAVASFRIEAPGREVRWARARRSERGDADLVLLDQAGSIVAEIEGLSLQAVNDPRSQGLASECLYEIAWRQSIGGGPRPLQGRWLLFVDGRGVGDGLRAALEAAGRPVLSIVRGDHYAVSDDGRVTCNPSRSQDYDRLLDDVAGDEPLGIAHLWSLDAPATEATTLDTLDAAQQSGALAVMHLAQALARRRRSAPTRVVLVTQGAQPVNGTVTSVAQAPIWGLGTTLARECPEIRTSLIDLDAEPLGAERLFQEIRTGDDELRVALRGEQRFVARLVRRTKRSGAHLQAPSLRADRTYVITGGAGAIGLAMAERLSQRGARHLGLLGRRPLDADLRTRIAALTANGADVHYVQADIADPRAVDRAMERLTDSAPPIAGIIHAAGVVDDAVMAKLSIQQATAVLAPKITGTWNLHAWSKDRALDFFVLCSSIAGVLGSAGQAPYAAGNAFLDAVAHARHRDGLAGQSIDWGGWADTGMVARMHEADAQRRAKATRLLSSTEGVDLFEAVLGDLSAVQVAAMRFVDPNGNAEGDRLLQELSASAVEPRPSAAQALAEKPSAQRGDFLPQYIRGLIGELLDRRPGEIADDVPFDDLGLDSLMTITCRRRLQEELGIGVSTMTWYDHNTVARLAEYVAGHLAGGRRDVAIATPAASPLVELQATGSEPPLYLVHPVGGTVSCYGALARAVGRRTFGFEATGVGGGDPVDRIEALADAYIDELLGRQPTGPYLLAGWSLGGCVAYEMARRLRAADREVALVALIDSHHPSMSQTAEGRALVRAALVGKAPQRDGHEPEDADGRAAMLRAFLWDYTARMEMPAVVAGDEDELWEAFERMGTPGATSRDDALRLFAVFQANVRAYRRYLPGEYQGRVLLVRSTEASTGEPDLGWRDVIPDLDVHVLTGDHYTVMRAPHVDRLGAILSASIEAALAFQRAVVI